MKSFKKALRLVGLIIMILLASVGVGLAGGAPLPFSISRKDTPRAKIELVEQKEEEQDEKDEDKT